MTKQNPPERNADEPSELEAAYLAEAEPSAVIPPIFNPPASGLYSWQLLLPAFPSPGPTVPATEAEGDAAFFIRSEELRLDVDGRYPQMVASGTVRAGIASRTNWIAKLTASGANSW